MLVKIDTTDTEDLLKKRTFEPIPPGKYIFEVENDLKVEASQSSDNQIVKVELRVVDDGEFKGRKVFDNLVIGATPETKKKCDYKIAQFAIACGVCTKDTLDEIDLDLFKGCNVNARIGVTVSTYQGDTKKKNEVKEYIFEAETTQYGKHSGENRINAAIFQDLNTVSLG